MRSWRQCSRACAKRFVNRLLDRDPDTGEFPPSSSVAIVLTTSRLHVEGSEKLVAVVKEKLGLDDTDQAANKQDASETPKVFLSYTSDNLELAQQIAEALMAAGNRHLVG